ncbi:MAG: hypothetical protein KC620_19935, partial [Myxococcales bacterium]|nr:hypothetical protein [Myxococcales bacterium]
MTEPTFETDRERESTPTPDGPARTASPVSAELQGAVSRRAQSREVIMMKRDDPPGLTPTLPQRFRLLSDEDLLKLTPQPGMPGPNLSQQPKQPSGFLDRLRDANQMDPLVARMLLMRQQHIDGTGHTPASDQTPGVGNMLGTMGTKLFSGVDPKLTDIPPGLLFGGAGALLLGMGSGLINPSKVVNPGLQKGLNALTGKMGLDRGPGQSGLGLTFRGSEPIGNEDSHKTNFGLNPFMYMQTPLPNGGQLRIGPE